MPYLKFAAGALLAALLLSRPEAAALGGLNAMLCWARTVAPAMFPFMALLPLLTGDGAARVLRRLAGRAMGRLFRLPGAAAGALAAAMLGGSPAGVLAARRVPGLRRGEFKRLAVCGAGLSPAFLVGGVGAAMLGDAGLGRVLLRSQLCAQLAMLLLLRRAWSGEDDALPPPEEARSRPLRAALLGILTVGGWMTLFGALGEAARPWLRGPAGEALLCLADVITGAERVSRLNCDLFSKMLLMSAVCGFGGACVGAQNVAAAGDAGPSAPAYFALRLPAAGLCVGATALQLRPDAWRNPSVVLPAAATILLSQLRINRVPLPEKAGG